MPNNIFEEGDISFAVHAISRSFSVPHIQAVPAAQVQFHYLVLKQVSGLSIKKGKLC